jgi:hypothetical protein
MMRQVLHTITGLTVIESLVFHFPAALGQMVEALGTGSVFGEVGQPVSFVDGAIGLGLSITEDANRLLAQAVPRIKVIGIPHFNPIPTTAEPLSGSRLGPSLLGLMPQLGQVGLQPGQHRQSQVCGSMQEGSGGIEAIGYDVIGKAGSQQLDGPLQQPLASRILAVAWAVGLDIEGQRQSGAHHTDQAEVVIMANDLMVWVQHRVTELASGLPTEPLRCRPAPSRCARSDQRLCCVWLVSTLEPALGASATGPSVR